nr:hypothetical protein [uncultured Desulfobulbus sp.]
MAACCLNVAPTEMGLTDRAMNDLPGVASKPGKLVTGRVVRRHARGVLKAAQFIGNACRVEKGVVVASARRDGVFFGGDRVEAVAAEKLVLLISGRLLPKRGGLPYDGFLFTFSTIIAVLQ